MDEVKQEVKQTEETSASETTQEVVKQEPVSTTQENAQETQEQETQTTQQVNADVDEFGVPWKNRAFEWRRKHEETVEKLPSLVEEAIKSSFQQYGNSQQREYTISELEAFAIQSPEHRPWVEEQKAQVIRKQLTKEVEEKFKSVEKAKETETTKQKSLNYVMSAYPDAFVRNQSGQIMGWNNSSPFTQQIGILMQEPELANNPRGLEVAADMAFARLSRMQQGANQAKEQKLKAEVKHLQKQTLIEGGGKSNVQAVPEFRKAIDKAKQTGSVIDVAQALREIAKSKSTSQEK